MRLNLPFLLLMLSTCSPVPAWSAFNGTGGSIGKVSIDQSNPGVTNGVVVNSGTVTANAGTNLNTSALSVESTQSSFKTANHSDLAAILSALGSPFQAGGSIANTAFTANAGTNLNTSLLATDAHLTALTSANHTDLTSSQPRACTLQAGAALAGKFGIDQTTPGTTNKVSIGTDGTVAVSGTVPVSLSSTNAPVNTVGSIANNAAVTSTPATFTAPANAVGFELMAESGNTQNIRWAAGSTASSSVGTLAEPGRDTGYIPMAANISVAAISGTQAVSVQWILSH